MKIQVLIDNLESAENFCGFLQPEWGLSAFIQFQGKTILLDTGASEKFAENAATLQVDLNSVDAGVLSHAHFDHANGMEAFFKVNDHANFYLRKDAGENCYHTHKFLKFFSYQEYIGIKRGTLKRFGDRVQFVDGTAEILPGVYLVGHNDNVFSSAERAEIASRNGLSIRLNGKYYPDSFDHEQSLVFDTPQGLFIMNSCSHGGADNIVKEVEMAFPGKKIYAVLGGFHLYRTSDSQVRAFAERLRDLDVQKIYTGHCTGNHAFEILKEVLGEKVRQMFTGMEIEV